MDESISSITTDNSICSKETMIYHEFEELSKEKKDRIISAISNNLNDLIMENRQNIKERYIKKDIFYLINLPMISIEEYLHHIMKYSQMSFSSLILAIMLIDKMCEKQKYILSFHNIHRLILTSCLISTKFNDDRVFNNKYFAHFGGVDLTVLNNLEYEYYVLLEFKIWVDQIYYQKYFNYFNKYIKINESSPE